MLSYLTRENIELGLLTKSKNFKEEGRFPRYPIEEMQVLL
jgi:hypothetical protein